jgi:ParB-like chromosome segregation protein Spo0J
VGVQIKKTKASPSSPESIERISARLKTSAIERVPLSAIRPSPRNSKKHPARKARLLAANILEFGFTSPILVDKDGVILAGHARYTAARRLGLPEIPIIRLAYLSPEQARCLAIADNKLAELGRWDFDQLAVELGELSDAKLDLTLDVELTGFETIDIDQIVKPKGRKAADESEFNRLPAPGPLISQPRDVWVCGDHVLCCGTPLTPTFMRSF